jgi:hypothetical protein
MKEINPRYPGRPNRRLVTISTELPSLTFEPRIVEFRISSVNVNGLAVRQIFRELFLPY